MAKTRKDDFLDEFIAERTSKNPAFPALVDAALERRRLGEKLAKARRSKKLSQQDVAKKMATTQSVVSKVERGGDVKVSTLLRYATVVGVEARLRA